MDECRCLLGEAHRQRRELEVRERRGRVQMAQTRRPRKAVAGDVTTLCSKLCAVYVVPSVGPQTALSACTFSWRLAL